MPGRYNEILVGRYNRALQKLLSMKGTPPAPQLASEIIASFPLFWGRENRYLEDWRLYAARGSVAGVAAQDTVIRLNNPANSGVIAVLESITIANNTATIVEGLLELSPTAASGDLGFQFTAVGFDGRFNPLGTGFGSSAVHCSGTNNVGQGTHVIVQHVLLPANAMTNDMINYENQEIVMAPNSSFQFRTATLNITINMSFRWRERPLESSELT